MKLLVAVKRVVDYNARIRVKADQVTVIGLLSIGNVFVASRPAATPDASSAA